VFFRLSFLLGDTHEKHPLKPEKKILPCFSWCFLAVTLKTRGTHLEHTLWNLYIPSEKTFLETQPEKHPKLCFPISANNQPKVKNRCLCVKIGFIKLLLISRHSKFFWHFNSFSDFSFLNDVIYNKCERCFFIFFLNKCLWNNIFFSFWYFIYLTMSTM
jgi:hypothetical protein